MALTLPPDHVAKLSAPTAHDKTAPAYECGPGVSNKADEDQAVVGRQGPVLEAVSGVCLVVVVYSAATATGAVIHLWRNEQLWPEQGELIRNVFHRFPQLCESPTVGFVSSAQVRDAHPDQLRAAKDVVRALAPAARVTDLLVGSPDHPDADPEMVAQGFDMSVEVCLGTLRGQLILFDDFGGEQHIELAAGGL